MPLFWIAHRIGGAPSIFIAEANTKLYARLAAARAGHAGEFAEAHELDVRTAKKIPKAMIGRALSQKEAAALVKKLE